MANTQSIYLLAMGIMALLLAAGLAAVGWNRYTPQTRKPIDAPQLERLRKYCRVGSPALFLLAVIYLAAALMVT